MKTQMVEALGEEALRLPAQVAAGLAANDRLKYYFSLLQMAEVHADKPDQAAPTLKHERLAAGIADGRLDAIVGSARREGDAYRISGLPKLIDAIGIDLRTMAAPVGKGVEPRLTSLLAALPGGTETVDAEAIGKLTKVDLNGTDSVHRLVMELHKQLNKLQADLAERRIDGAAAFHLLAADEALVHAFMTGLNRTAPLKFDHPGLGTTATRVGKRLIIQNDIGTTDAHVIVIHVEGRKVTLTYSDVHLERLQFFQSLFERFQVSWSGPRGDHNPALAGGETFFLATAEFRARGPKQLTEYLEFLGSRLVFLIDWNRARKELRGLLPKELRLKLLRWAAETDTGHRGFLELGGARLIYGAVEAAPGAAVRFGDRLSDVLGDDVAFALVQFAFAAATQGLLAHQSESLIRDRVRAELLNHLNTAQDRLLTIAADHAGLIFEIAASVRDVCLTADANGENVAKRTRRWEHDADLLLVEVTRAVKRRTDLDAFRQIASAADDSADSLEETAFLLGLRRDAMESDIAEAVRALAAILAGAAQEWVKAVNHARHVQRHGTREDIDAFLTAIDRLLALEHDADDAERHITRVAMAKSSDFRELHLATGIGRGLEEAADALKRAGILLRDRIMGEIMEA